VCVGGVGIEVMVGREREIWRFRDFSPYAILKGAVVEESVWHLEKQFVAAVVADEHGNVFWIIAVERLVAACRGLGIHGTSEKTLEQRCTESVFLSRR
jgi:hypothetical protein